MQKIFLNKKTLLTFFLLFIIFRPQSFINYNFLDSMINFFRVIIAVMLIYKYLKLCKISVPFLLVLLIWSSYNILCLYNKTWQFSSFIKLALPLCVVIIVEINLYNGCKSLNKALSILLLFYGIANTITILLGFDVSSLFLGFDNDIVMMVIPMLGVMLFTSIVIHNKYTKLDIFISLIYVLDFILTWSVTAMVSLTLMYILIFMHKINFRNLTSSKIIIYSFLMNFLVQILKIQKYLSWILVDLLKKDITFSYRTYIWDAILHAFTKSPLWGFGNYSINYIYITSTKSSLHNIIYLEGSDIGISTHNFWLYIIISGGVLGLILILIFIYTCFKNINKFHNKKESKILLSSLLGYLLCGFAASYYAIENLVFLLLIAYHSKSIINYNNKHSNS